MKITTTGQLAAYLQDIRQSKGLSQAKVGEKIGVRQGTVSNFEQNPASTKLDTLFKLLSALELEVEIKPRNATAGTKGETPSEAHRWDQEW
ncbi:helix-turn-helix domain-containing protein [Ferrimonas balearica]|uniref:helix-turn-helix domain-containing protein n=1 Tax=Ferrimonas balearica TaxID=44012 RepID=UPI001C94CA80|nr:helix-turn-helix domain-containing protein [Ferrimonas balearica]MBY6108283.1 helix-turn-helix domain-containing protein [Ferrimonas balearica]